MIGRVSFNGRYDTMIRNMQRVTSRYQDALVMATTGKQVNGPSDEPAAYSRILAGRTQQRQLSDYRNGLGLALQEMQLADSVLDTAANSVSRARELAVGGANVSYSASDRAAMAEEVQAIREDVLRIANTRFNDRYIFSGYQYDQPAFDDTGAYQGDAGARSYIAGDGVTLQVNQTGDEVFAGAGGGEDVFAVLEDLEAALNADDTTAVQATLDRLDGALSQLNQARSTYGARINQATELNALYEQQEIHVSERVSLEEDIDATVAYSEVARLSTAMQATLQVSASASRLSLLDYL